MKASRKDQFRLSEEAALWLVRLQEEPDASCRDEFFAWLRQSPRHMEEFMFTRAVSTQLNYMDPQRKINIDRAALASLGDEFVVKLDADERLRSEAPSHTTNHPTARRNWPWMTALAATLVAAFLAWVWRDFITGAQQTYATSTGDQQSIKLRDGSFMQLNTHSRATVRFSEHARQIQLLEGEALFVVAKDRVRPFRVIAGTAIIEAIGTQFNVYRRPEGTRVSVVEGAVQVSPGAYANAEGATEPVRLEAGTEASISARRVVKDAKPDVERAVAWRSRSLVFHSDRLDHVVGEFNRYNRTPIRLEGTAIAERQISGIFDADDPQPLIKFLIQQPDFSVVETDREIVIRPRDP